MSQLKIALGNLPHQLPLKNGAVKIDGVDAEFVEVRPITTAFANMARHLAYDVSEMAIATYLMARDNGIPVTLLPIVVSGGYHHTSLLRLPSSKSISPIDLVGQKVGVRAYSQTTGLWVRGVLQEEFSVASGDMTWMTTEGPHVLQYDEPPYVERSGKSLFQMLEDGDIAAAVANSNSANKKFDVELPSIIPDIAERQLDWGKRHQTIPINHMVTVQTSLLENDPKAVRAIYQALVKGIESTQSLRGDAPKDRAVTYGLNDQLMRAIDIAICYAQQQDMLTNATSAEEIFADANVYL